MLLIYSPAEHEAAMVKYSRLPKKKENEKVEWVRGPKAPERLTSKYDPCNAVELFHWRFEYN